MAEHHSFMREAGKRRQIRFNLPIDRLDFQGQIAPMAEVSLSGQ
jgi:hypothetical protein